MKIFKLKNAALYIGAMLIFTAQAAPTGTGNGGGVISCYDRKELKFVMLYDLWEGASKGLTMNIYSKQNKEFHLKRAYRNLERIHPALEKELRKRVKVVESKIDESMDFVTGNNLTIPESSKVLYVPKQCPHRDLSDIPGKYESMIVWEDSGRMNTVPDLFKEIKKSGINHAATLIHEGLFDILRDLHPEFKKRPHLKEQTPVRNLTARLLSASNYYLEGLSSDVGAFLKGGNGKVFDKLEKGDEQKLKQSAVAQLSKGLEVKGYGKFRGELLGSLDNYEGERILFDHLSYSELFELLKNYKRYDLISDLSRDSKLEEKRNTSRSYRVFQNGEFVARKTEAKTAGFKAAYNILLLDALKRGDTKEIQKMISLYKGENLSELFLNLNLSIYGSAGKERTRIQVFKFFAPYVGEGKQVSCGDALRSLSFMDSKKVAKSMYQKYLKSECPSFAKIPYGNAQSNYTDVELFTKTLVRSSFARGGSNGSYGNSLQLGIEIKPFSLYTHTQEYNEDAQDINGPSMSAAQYLNTEIELTVPGVHINSFSTQFAHRNILLFLKEGTRLHYSLGLIKFDHKRFNRGGSFASLSFLEVADIAMGVEQYLPGNDIKVQLKAKVGLAIPPLASRTVGGETKSFEEYMLLLPVTLSGDIKSIGGQWEFGYRFYSGVPVGTDTPIQYHRHEGIGKYELNDGLRIIGRYQQGELSAPSRLSESGKNQKSSFNEGSLGLEVQF